jgi:hypothetical protein
VLVLDGDHRVAEPGWRRRPLVDAVVDRENLLDRDTASPTPGRLMTYAVEPSTAIAITTASTQTPLMIRRRACEPAGATRLAARGTAMRIGPV